MICYDKRCFKVFNRIVTFNKIIETSPEVFRIFKKRHFKKITTGRIHLQIVREIISRVSEIKHRAVGVQFKYYEYFMLNILRGIYHKFLTNRRFDL